MMTKRTVAVFSNPYQNPLDMLKKHGSNVIYDDYKLQITKDQIIEEMKEKQDYLCKRLALTKQPEQVLDTIRSSACSAKILDARSDEDLVNLYANEYTEIGFGDENVDENGDVYTYIDENGDLYSRLNYHSHHSGENFIKPMDNAIRTVMCDPEAVASSTTYDQTPDADVDVLCRKVDPYSNGVYIKDIDMVDCAADRLDFNFVTDAVLTPYGEWISYENSGNEYADHNSSEYANWLSNYKERFLENADPELRVTIFEIQ